MTVSFDKARSRWKFDFWHKGKRFQGYCLDAAGEPVTSKSSARQAEGVMQAGELRLTDEDVNQIEAFAETVA